MALKLSANPEYADDLTQETYCDKPELGTLLRENTWSNNLHIMSKTKSDAERLFYLKLASREKYKAKELERQIDSGYYERLMLSDGKAPSAISQAAPANIIRDMYMLEFLDLPEPYREYGNWGINGNSNCGHSCPACRLAEPRKE